MNTVTAWKNEYGSVMRLEQSPSGEVWGIYKSDTGSTGEYRVRGYADPAPAAGWGQSIALNIYWRSITGGEGDPSWHWVSGLSGQIVARSSDNVPTLILMHAMVATTNFPGLVTVGTYSDKLIYTPDDTAELSLPPLDCSETGEDCLCGQWICEQQPSMVITLQCADAGTGAVGGTLRAGNVQYALTGFTDVQASADDLPLQSLALAAMIPAGLRGGTSCLSLAGSLNRLDRRLSLLAAASQGTEWNTRYLATTTAGLTFRPAD